MSALARDLGERVVLHADALLSHPLLRLDEGAADVAVLDQPLAERDPGSAREADRRRRAGVGDRQHEVGLDRRLLGEPLAHSHARAVHLDAGEARVGAGEIEELEDAERSVLGRLERLDRVQPVLVRDDELARPDLALERRADEVECARLRGDDRVVAEPAEHERAEAERGRGTRRACRRRARPPSLRLRAVPSWPRRPPRAAARRRRSARRSPPSPTTTRAACRRARAAPLG